jgi:DNA-binding NtrC family response regulator
VNHFLEKYNQQNDKHVTKLSQGVLDVLLKYPWPGNVRELENCIERAVVMSPSKVLTINILPEELLSYTKGTSPQGQRKMEDRYNEFRQTVQKCCETSEDLAEVKDTLSRLIEDTLIRELLSGKISQRDLAKKLGMSRTTLRKKMRELGINP